MNEKKNPVFVTKPDLPALQDFIPYLEKIWHSRVLTNSGPFHKQLEDALCRYLNVPFISLFSNGTIALITALKALGIKGEVITTPYSFVATAHSLIWNNLTPVFVDIDRETLNLDPSKIEEAITPQTTAILPVHVYGNPCDVEKIQNIALKHNLKVIYDASHAFAVKCHCGSILNHGDMSVLSFHATKVFNTFEGGAIICKDLKTKMFIDQLKNFGYTSETTVTNVGINGKMSEFNSALGLLQLDRVDQLIQTRKTLDKIYRKGLANTPGIRCLKPLPNVSLNYSYFPIFIERDYPLTRDQLYKHLKKNGINGRRYFYPLITEFPMYQKIISNQALELTNARLAASSVICLPIFPDLPIQQLTKIINLIRKNYN